LNSISFFYVSANISLRELQKLKLYHKKRDRGFKPEISEYDKTDKYYIVSADGLRWWFRT